MKSPIILASVVASLGGNAALPDSRQAFELGLRHGLLLRPMGNTVYFMPPYVISDAEMAQLVQGSLAEIASSGREQLEFSLRAPLPEPELDSRQVYIVVPPDGVDIPI